jgi:hypothetical protein
VNWPGSRRFQMSYSAGPIANRVNRRSGHHLLCSAAHRGSGSRDWRGDRTPTAALRQVQDGRWGQFASRIGTRLCNARIRVYRALDEGGSPRTPFHLAVFGAFLFHFARRIFEVSFVNSYSRPTPLRALVIIASLYGGVAASCAFFHSPYFWPAHFPPDLHPRGSHLCLRRGVKRIPSFAFSSSPPAGHSQLCCAASRLVWLGGLSPLLGRNFEFCGIRNDV